MKRHLTGFARFFLHAIAAAACVVGALAAGDKGQWGLCAFFAGCAVLNSVTAWLVWPDEEAQR